MTNMILGINLRIGVLVPLYHTIWRRVKTLAGGAGYDRISAPNAAYPGPRR